MNAMMRRVVIGTAAVSMALSVAACGKAGDDKDKKRRVFVQALDSLLDQALMRGEIDGDGVIWHARKDARFG